MVIPKVLDPFVAECSGDDWVLHDSSRTTWSRVDPLGTYGFHARIGDGGGLELESGAFGAEPVFYAEDGGKRLVTTSPRTLVLRGFAGPTHWQYRGDFPDEFRGHISPFPNAQVLRGPFRICLQPSEAIVIPSRDEEPQGHPLDGKRLLAALTDAMTVCERSETVLLLSGGVDSALLATLAARLGLRLRCVCVWGRENSPDLAGARAIAEACGFELQEVQFRYEDLLSLLPATMGLFQDPRPDLATIPIVLFAVQAAAQMGDLVVGGEPADIVLGAYSDLTEARSQEEQQHVFRNGIEVASGRTLLTLSRCARAYGMIPLQPYSHTQIRTDALATPVPILAPHLKAFRAELSPPFKAIQREAAEVLGDAALLKTFDAPKVGFPAAGVEALRELLIGLQPAAQSTDSLECLFLLTSCLFRSVIIDGSPPTDIDVKSLLGKLPERA